MAILASHQIVAGSTPELLFSIDQSRRIQQITASEHNNVASRIWLWLVPHDTARGDEHKIINDRALPANSTLLLLEHDWNLSLGEKIWVQADTTDISFTLIGV